MVTEPAYFIDELDILEPFGNGNPKPQFAQKNIVFKSGRILGANKNVAKYSVENESGKEFEMIYFGDIEALNEYMISKFGQNRVENLYRGYGDSIQLSVVYYPDINEYKGNTSIQMVMKYYQ